MSKRYHLTLVGLAALFAVLTTILVVKALTNWKNVHTGDKQVSVVVAVKQVAPHQVVDATDVALKQLPANAVESNALTSIDSVVGHYAASTWFEGQEVIAPMVVQNESLMSFPMSIPKGYRAFTISDDPVTGVDHLVSAGDSVDVLVSYSDQKLGGPSVKTLLENILVLHVDNAPTSDDTNATVNSSSASQNTNTAKVDTLTLAVTPDEARALYFGESFGQLHAVLRRPGKG